MSEEQEHRIREAGKKPADALKPPNQQQTANKQLKKKKDLLTRVMFGTWAQSMMDEIEECKGLPEGERFLPIDMTTGQLTWEMLPEAVPRLNNIFGTTMGMG